MNDLMKQFEKETGEKALYRRESSDFHTLKYVNWLEDKLGAAEPSIYKKFYERVLELKKKHKDNYEFAGVINFMTSEGGGKYAPSLMKSAAEPPEQAQDTRYKLTIVCDSGTYTRMVDKKKVSVIEMHGIKYVIEEIPKGDFLDVGNAPGDNNK